MEQDIITFIRDPVQQQLEFQQLPTSYLRLAAHRVAQHYNLRTTVMLDNSLPDGSGSRIVAQKSNECCLPMIRLVDIPINVSQEDSNSFVRVAIKQRPQKHSQASNTKSHSSNANHLKSVEERKEEYNRARARIFSSNNSGVGSGGMLEVESPVFNNFQQCSSLASTRLEEKAGIEGPEFNLSRSLGDSSAGSSSNKSGRNNVDKEPATRNKSNNRVAIFRDREVDRKDPDYDRTYERYVGACFICFFFFFAS